MWSSAGDIRNAMITLDEILSIHESSNRIQLITGGHDPEPAVGYLLEFKRNDTAGCVACVFFPGSGSLETYAPEEGQRFATEDDGLGFLEGIGFMMSDLQFGTMSADEKERCVERLPFLSWDRAEFLRKTREQEKSAEKPSREAFYGESAWQNSTGINDTADKSMEDRVRIARFLAAF